MLLKPLYTQHAVSNATQQGLVDGTGYFSLASGVLGGVNVSGDATNTATITIRQNDANGAIIFQAITTTPQFVAAPLQAGSTCYYSISGTGAKAMFYEWVE